MSPTTETINAFGKLIYSPKDKSYPMLPDLNVLVFWHKEDNGIYSYSAACIQLELDACGNSVDEAIDELLQAIGLYFNAQAKSCVSLEEFTERIIGTIFDTSAQKDELFNLYRDAKRNYLMNQAQNTKVQMPRMEPSSMASFLFNKNLELTPVAVN